jgi:hypothetical protein
VIPASHRSIHQMGTCNRHRRISCSDAHRQTIATGESRMHCVSFLFPSTALRQRMRARWPGSAWIYDGPVIIVSATSRTILGKETGSRASCQVILQIAERPPVPFPPRSFF